MEDAIKGIEKTAHKQAKKAARMWVECRQIIESASNGNRPAAIRAAMELNYRAIEQARESMNRFDFVRRYRLGSQGPSKISDRSMPTFQPGRSGQNRPSEEI